MAFLAASADCHLLACLDGTPLYPADADAAYIVVIVDIGEEHLGGPLQISLGSGDFVQDHFEEGGHVCSGNVRIQGGVAIPGGAVDHRELQLVIVGPQLNEQVQHFIHHFRRAGAGPVDFVQYHQGLFPQSQSFFQHKAGLGHTAFKSVYQQQNAVYHHQHPFYLAAEIRVTRGVHNVDLGVLIFYGGIFG